MFVIADKVLRVASDRFYYEVLRYIDFEKSELKREWYWSELRFKEPQLWAQVWDQACNGFLTWVYCYTSPNDRFWGCIVPVGGAIFWSGLDVWKSPVLWTWVLMVPWKYHNFFQLFVMFWMPELITYPK